ncbi:MAG: YraN family protein [Acidobacteriota bacterium]|nr:YraN family protein [Acidobacteriota bacterium]
MAKNAAFRRSWLELTVRFLGLLEGTRIARASNAPHLALGIAGEEEAFFYLKRRGYEVVARRWTSHGVRGDLDLIAWKGPLLCFVEVKTRSKHDIAAAEVAVDDTKRRVMRKLARRYVRQLPRAGLPPCRFDVMSVYLTGTQPPEIFHFEGSFGWRDDEYE